jgi:transcriptional accessory protein Tex/SPT6
MARALNKRIYYKFFGHFALRLVERYNIFITFEEYVSLSQLPYLKKPKMRIDNEKGFHACEGFLKIQGTDVRVIRSTVHYEKPLLTALPIKKCLN